MKIKSDLAAKRAVRLVEAMSDQCGTVKKKDFEEVDYKKTYRYAADRQLELTGLIKKTKGKRWRSISIKHLLIGGEMPDR